VLHITGGAHNLSVTQATADNVATLGRFVSGRVDVEPAFVNFINGQFGDNTLSSDGIPGFLSTTGHDMHGVGGAGLMGTDLYKPATPGRGYFDPGTESLRNIAAASIGEQNKMVGAHPYHPPISIGR